MSDNQLEKENRTILLVLWGQHTMSTLYCAIRQYS
jgi:hypothetical protein